MARSVRIEFPGAYYHLMASWHEAIDGKRFFSMTMTGDSFCNVWPKLARRPAGVCMPGF